MILKTQIQRLWSVTALLIIAAAPGAFARQDIYLEDLVRNYLWPSSKDEFKKAHDALLRNPALENMSRARFHDLEEIIRGGPSEFPQLNGNQHQLQVATPEGEITVFVELPPGYHAGARWPLMFAMHGGPPRTARQAISGARRMVRVWREAAARAGWIVAAPAMTTVCSVDQSTRERLPYEILHLEQVGLVLDALSQHFSIDPNRIVSTGISLGSNFSIAFAAAQPDLFSAIVPVSTEGESRESLLRNLAAVPVYLLEGTQDSNIRAIAGPRAMRDILVNLGYDITYREFGDRAHEGFQEHYGDVLRWLGERPRRNYPGTALRIPHPGIIPTSKQVHWVECYSRQGLVRARLKDGNRIDVDTWRNRSIRLFLHDRMVDLDRPVEVWINGMRAFSDRLNRSARVALEQAKRGRIWASQVDIEVPTGPEAAAWGRQFSREMEPEHPGGQLSYWEMYAVKALEERFPDLGFEGMEEPIPSGWEGMPDQRAIRIDSVQSGSAAAGLRIGDLLLEFGGEPFFAGDGPEGLYHWLIRELRSSPKSYPLLVWRDGAAATLAASYNLNPYTSESPPPPPRERPLITFDRYHRVPEFEAFLEAAASRYPDKVRILEFGRSREGRRLLAAEITNPKTGPAGEKPAFYLDGNIHGGEVLAGEGALYFINHMLTQYGKDPETTALIDTMAFYVVTLVNPDGREISIETPENHRWNIRPVDEDGDGRFDEDPPEDLDGDGRILRMRVPDAEGNWKISAEDPRIMVRKRSDESGGTYYSVYSEGFDNDRDGRINEDRVGGIDVNRNFPANWHPGQHASGPFPLSEPEARALVEYITARPNIAAIHTYHTSGGLLLRFPTLADQNWNFPEKDLEDYRVIAEEGSALTGYANYAYEKQKIVDLMSPGHGVFNDWASKVFGVMAITTEMWKHPMGRGSVSQFSWNDKVLEGKGFVDWRPFQHPQLGPVELGGWDRWSMSNPPEHLIADELKRNNDWVLTFARRMPRVAILDLNVTQTGQDGSYIIEARVENSGWMPTATAYAAEVLKTAKPVRVELNLSNGQIKSGSPRDSLGILPGSREGGPLEKKVSWEIHLASGRASATVVVSSEKAGTVRRTISIP